MEEQISFEPLTESLWKIESPGILKWDGTGFTIVSDFTNPTPWFSVIHSNYECGGYYTIEGAQANAKYLARQMLRMGLEP